MSYWLIVPLNWNWSVPCQAKKKSMSYLLFITFNSHSPYNMGMACWQEAQPKWPGVASGSVKVVKRGN